MRAYEFRKYLLGKDINEADIKNHIENVRRIEKALGKTAESLSSIDEVESQLTWHVLPWKKDELLESLRHYFAFNKLYVKPSFKRTTLPFKECPECGEKTPLGSMYCRKCGTQIGKTQFKQINEMYDSVEDKWIHHRGIMIGGAVAIVALILVGIMFAITAFPVPDVVGQEPIAAKRMLIESGLNEQSIYIQCGLNDLSNDDIAKGEYEVIIQTPKAGRKVHKSTDIMLECKDLYRERAEAVGGCRYYKATEAEAVAKEYRYTYKEKALSEDIPQGETLYVASITDQDDDKRSVVFEVDSKKNIEKRIVGLVDEIVGKPAKDGETIGEQTGCDISYINSDQEEVYSSDDDFEYYQVTGFKSFDFNEKDIAITVDTTMNIEEKEFIASLKDKIPYVGMSEDYIDETGAGKHTSEEEDIGWGSEIENRYVWKSKDGKYDVLTVICTDWEVTEVTKDNEEAFWKGELPDYSVDADAVYAEIARKEAEEEARLEAEAEKQAAIEKKKEDESKANYTVYVTRTGDCYHFDGCRYLKSKARTMTQGEALSIGYDPCNYCVSGYDIPSNY